MGFRDRSPLKRLQAMARDNGDKYVTWEAFMEYGQYWERRLTRLEVLVAMGAASGLFSLMIQVVKLLA